MSAPRSADALPIVDLLKVVGSQLIVWHHLVLYGPMSHVVQPLAGEVFDWLCNQAPMAVQIFLVVGGFLAARSLRPLLRADGPAPLALIGRRLGRLVPAYWAALALALLAALFARSLMQHDATPPAPSAGQLLAHLFLLKDVLGYDGLSAGVWFVAIDWQLYSMLVLLLWAGRLLAWRSGASTATVCVLLCLAATAASLLWFNRDSSLDAWAPYFFGAYGLGVLAYVAKAQRSRLSRAIVIVGMATLVAMALDLHWRPRIAVAALVALALLLHAQLDWRWMRHAALIYLARISYAVFLVHYPMCLLVNALVHPVWPDSELANGLGLLLAWSGSLLAGAVFHHVVEEGWQRWLSARLRRSWNGASPAQFG